MIAARTATGHALWSDSDGDVEVRFVGRGAGDDRQELARQAGAGRRQVAWNRQVHSARVLPAAAGCCGEADALVTADPCLVLSVVTADCVPVLIGGDGAVTAVHAGWRGIAGGVVSAALERLGHGAPTAAELTAWLGPAIGACCYEVGSDVARRVARASTEAAIVAVDHGKPHLDLAAAVTAQLDLAGVRTVRRVDACTRCRPDLLWSYRRDGPRAGRNLALVWLERPASGGAGGGSRRR